MEACRVLNLGLVDYLQVWDLQKALVDRVTIGAEPNTLLILQHPHIYTIGRRGSRQDVLLTDEQVVRLGASVHNVDRGGECPVRCDVSRTSPHAWRTSA